MTMAVFYCAAVPAGLQSFPGGEERPQPVRRQCSETHGQVSSSKCSCFMVYAQNYYKFSQSGRKKDSQQFNFPQLPVDVNNEPYLFYRWHLFIKKCTLRRDEIPAMSCLSLYVLCPPSVFLNT